MSADFTFEIKGLEEVQAKLEALKEKIARTGVRNALRAGATFLMQRCVMLAPRLTGFLAEHFDIKISVRSDAIAGSAFIGPNAKALYPHAEMGPQTKERDAKGNTSRTAYLVAK